MILTEPNLHLPTHFTFAHGDLFSKLGAQLFLGTIYYQGNTRQSDDFPFFFNPEHFKSACKWLCRHWHKFITR